MQMLEAGSGRLAELVDVALDGLRDLLKSDAPPAVRLQAARCVLESCLRFREAVSVERRIAALESVQAENGGAKCS